VSDLTASTFNGVSKIPSNRRFGHPAEQQQRVKTWILRQRSAPLSFIFAAMNPRSAIRRALVGTEFCLDEDHIYTRNFEVPSGGGVGTARAIAKAYGVFANDG